MIKVIDNGLGLGNETRFLSWAAAKTETAEHRNGHGHKKALAKWMKDFATAKWHVQYRKAGQNLKTFEGPFLGSETPRTESDDDQTTLMPHGMETMVQFDPAILGRFADPAQFCAGLKELIQTRYCEQILSAVTFELDVETETGHITKNSRDEAWHSFRWHVEAGVTAGYIRALKVNEEHESKDAPWRLSVFKILPKGSETFPLKKEFPTYGKKNLSCQRVHTALKGGRGYRTIEIAHLYPFRNRSTAHNDDNGYIVFVEFTSDDLKKQPPPTTTKVALFPDDEIYKQFAADLKEYLKMNALVEPDGGASSPESAVQPQAPAARVERVLLVGSELGVSFHLKNGVMHVDFHDGTGMRPVRNYKLTLREDAPTPSTA